jgi:hypothetical protein
VTAMVSDGQSATLQQAILSFLPDAPSLMTGLRNLACAYNVLHDQSFEREQKPFQKKGVFRFFKNYLNFNFFFLDYFKNLKYSIRFEVFTDNLLFLRYLLVHLYLLLVPRHRGQESVPKACV